MRSWAMAAALATLPTAAAAQLPACVSTPDPLTRQQMLDDISAWRRFQLSADAADPLTIEFGARLEGVRAAVESAAKETQLKAARQALHDWKVDLLARKFSTSTSGGLGQPFCSYVNAETRSTRSAAALAAALPRQERVAAATRGRFAAFQNLSAALAFDGARAAPDASAVTVSPLDPQSPARYAKVRSLLISQGADPAIVDKAIREAIRQKADPLLVLSVINAESGFDPLATSYKKDKKGRFLHDKDGKRIPLAKGLMQLTADKGRNLYNIDINLHLGVAYLKEMWNRFVGYSMSTLSSLNPFAHRDVKEAIAAYNAGPGAVDAYNGVPPYHETQGYIVNVLSYYQRLKRYLGL